MPTPPSVPLPSGWPKHARSALLHSISLGATALTVVHGWAARQRSSGLRLRAELQRLERELALLREELRLKDARLARLPARERPHFPVAERLALLELRAARGWSARETAARFHLSAGTLFNWMRRIDKEGVDALLRPPVPANKYPDYVAHVVQRLRALCPSFGYGKIAQVLAREGLRLAHSTVRLMTQRKIRLEPDPVPERRSIRPRENVIARSSDHVWHCDLTTIPTSIGSWSPACPFGLPQRWPFCWWLVVVADQFSARILRLAIFPKAPSAEQVLAVVARAIDDAGVVPAFLITDKGPQFRDGAFRSFCRQRGILHRSGSLGQFGSIPFVERVILTVKRECTRRILVPFSRSGALKELALFATWYNRIRPHERHAGATPEEIHGGVVPIGRNARLESGDRPALRVRYLEGRKHLPVVALERAA
jgi:transposase InsO family protein